MRTFFFFVAVLSGVLFGVFSTLVITAGQVDPIDQVISCGDDVQIVGVVETLDSRVVTFIHGGGVYTALYHDRGELLVGEVYFLTENKVLVPVRYRAKE